MTRLPGLRLLALAGAAVAWLTPLDALGYWTVAGNGVASASVTALATPTGVSASSTPGSNTVSVSWDAAAAPDMGSVDGYYVLRYRGSTPSAACRSSPGSLLSSTHCDDTTVSSGAYTYRVVAVWRSWTSVSAPGNSVTVVDDDTPPMLSSIARTGAGSVNAGPLGWTVTFSEPVSGVAVSSFALATSGLSGTAPSISSVTASGGAPSATWTVSVSTSGTTGSNAGSIRLDLTSATDIADAAANPLSASLPVVGQAYVYDTTAPTPTSIARAGSTPTNTGPLAFTVTFSEPVSNVLAARFTLATSGLGGIAPSISSVTASGGAPSATWTVSVSTSGTTGSNAGSIRLDLTSATDIADAAANPLSASLPVVGQAYVYDTTAPTASDIQATNGGSTAGRIGTGDVITYTFSEAMSPTTILAGWSGSSTAVSVTVANSGSNDTITVVGTNLGTIATGGNYVTATSTIAATMAMSGSIVTVTLTSSPTSPSTVASSTMTWTPSSSAKDLAGNAMSTPARTESGAPKRNF